MILTNSTYIGKVRYSVNKENYFETNGFHQAIITDKQFVKANKMLLKSKKTNQCYDAYFSKRLKCKCGSFMIPKRIYKKNKLGEVKMYINY